MQLSDKCVARWKDENEIFYIQKFFGSNHLQNRTRRLIKLSDKPIARLCRAGGETLGHFRGFECKEPGQPGLALTCIKCGVMPCRRFCLTCPQHSGQRFLSLRCFATAVSKSTVIHSPSILTWHSVIMEPISGETPRKSTHVSG